MSSPASGANSMQGLLASEVLCPVCLELLEEPVILSCAHNVCLRCIKVLIASQKLVEPVVSSSLVLSKCSPALPAPAQPASPGAPRFEDCCSNSNMNANSSSSSSSSFLDSAACKAAMLGSSLYFQSVSGSRFGMNNSEFTAMGAPINELGAEDLFGHQHQSLPNASPPAARFYGSLRVKCPLGCTMTTPCDEDNLRGSMLVNTTLRNVVERISTELKKRSLCEIGACADAPGKSESKASVFCSECKNTFYCLPCFKLTHQYGKLRSHDPTPLQEQEGFSTATSTNCPVHPNKELEFYCLTCSSTCCYLCEKSTVHKHHNVIPLAEHSATVEVEAKENLQKVQQTMNRLHSHRQSLVEQRQGVVEMLDSKISSINNALQVFARALEQRGQQFVSELVDFKEQVNQDFEHQLNWLETAIGELSCINRNANEALQSKNVLRILQYAARAQILAKQNLTSSLDLNFNLLDSLEIGFNEQEFLEQISSLGCIKIEPSIDFDAHLRILPPTPGGVALEWRLPNLMPFRVGSNVLLDGSSIVYSGFGTSCVVSIPTTSRIRTLTLEFFMMPCDQQLGNGLQWHLHNKRPNKLQFRHGGFEWEVTNEFAYSNDQRTVTRLNSGWASVRLLPSLSVLSDKTHVFVFRINKESNYTWFGLSTAQPSHTWIGKVARTFVFGSATQAHNNLYVVMERYDNAYQATIPSAGFKTGDEVELSVNFAKRLMSIRRTDSFTEHKLQLPADLPETIHVVTSLSTLNSAITLVSHTEEDN